MTHQELKKLIKEEIRQALTEADIVPVGPDGNKIEDPQVIKNLNMAIKSVSATLRPKLIQIIEDPDAAKTLSNASQRAALLGAIAIAFGITESDFTQIVTKIKSVLPK
jgi:hypothetical protein